MMVKKVIFLLALWQPCVAQNWAINTTGTRFEKFFPFKLGKMALATDEFTGNSIGSNAIGQLDWGKSTVNSGSGFSDSYSYSSGEPFYSFRLSSGITSGGGQAIFVEGLQLDNFSRFVFFARLKPAQVSNVIISAGVANNVAAGTNVDYPTDAVYFWFDPDSSTSWQITTEKASVRTTKSLNITAAVKYINLAFYIRDSRIEVYASRNLDGMVYLFSMNDITTSFMKPHFRVQTRTSTQAYVHIGYFLLAGE